MKKNKPYYLKFYREWMKTGQLMGFGLCHALCNSDSKQYQDWLYGRMEIVTLFKPDKYPHVYWGSGSSRNEMKNRFTPLRQTIVLFLAAMNNEL